MKIQFPSIKTATKVLFCGAVLVAAIATGVSAKELRLAAGVPPAHPGYNPLYTDFKELLPQYSDQRLSARLLGTEITTLGNMRAAIRSGLVEIGLLVPAYFPADLPNFNLLGDLAMLGDSNPQVTAAALTEYVITCGDCQSEFKKLGIVFTTSHANPYNLLTTTPVVNPEDMQGLRIRTPTPQHARWVEAMGGKAVNMPIGETFEALSQGVIDGTVSSIADTISFNLGEVISNITLLDLGTFHTVSNHSVKSSVWNGLSVSDHEAVFRATIVASIRATARWLEMIEKGNKIAREKGLKRLEPSENLVARTVDFKEQDLAQAATRSEERFGVKEAERKIARFEALVQKWKGLIAETDGSKEAIASLYESEILSGIDLATYGK